MDKFDYYLTQKRLAESTREGIIRHVKVFHLWIEQECIPDITEVSYNDIMAFVKHCNEKGNTQKTIAMNLWFLNHYFKWLVKEGEMRENPVSHIKIQGIQRKHLQHYLKKEQLEALYNNFQPTGITAMRNRVILGLVIYQGLRTEEIGRLMVKDIKFKEGKIAVIGGRKTNGRTLKLEAHQVVELLEYLSEGRKEMLSHTGRQTEKLFMSSCGTGENLKNTCQYIITQVRAQNKDVKSWKHIRASVISLWISIYGLRKAQYLAGHRYISSTEEYKQQNLDELQDDINQFHPLR